MLVKIEARILIFPGTDFHFPSTSGPTGTLFRLWSVTSTDPVETTPNKNVDKRTKLATTVSRKKQDTKLLPITPANINRFSKSLHRQM